MDFSLLIALLDREDDPEEMASATKAVSIDEE